MAKQAAGATRYVHPLASRSSSSKKMLNVSPLPADQLRQSYGLEVTDGSVDHLGGQAGDFDYNGGL